MTDESLASRIEHLGEVATALETCHTEAEVYDCIVAVSDSVLTFDSAIVCCLEDGQFIPQAVRAQQLTPAPALSLEDGIAGITVRAGEIQVVADAKADETARPTSEDITSILSIPIEDSCVLQFHHVEQGAFSETDRRLGTVLASTVNNTLERVRYEQALGRERDQFAALFENIPDAALQYRMEGGAQIIEAVNSAFVSTFGDCDGTIVGEAVEDILSPAPECDEQLVEAEVTNNAEVVRETVAGARPFLLRSVPMRTTDGLPRGYLIYTDLTPQREREQKLEQKNQRLDEFASILSHDLRNPLSIAQLYAQQEQKNQDTKGIQKILDALERIDQLIRDVLTLTRSEQGIDPEPDVSVEGVARRAWDNVATGEATLEIHGHIVCTADSTHLQRLLENLFRNAIEHGGEAGDKTSEITVEVSPLDDGFAVEDNGPGIPPESREKVFDSGYTSGVNNTGLGLAIVHRITTSHGWSVALTDGKDGGARFEFTTRENEHETSERA